MLKIDNFINAKDDISVLLYGKELIEQIESMIDDASKRIMETVELGTYSVEDCNKILNITMQKKNTIDSKVIDELSDEEIRKTYKVTEKALKDLGKTDLIEKYKSFTEEKVMKVTKKKIVD